MDLYKSPTVRNKAKQNYRKKIFYLEDTEETSDGITAFGGEIMYNNEIDVAAIMREIKASVVPQNDFTLAPEQLNGLIEVRDAYKELNRIQEFITNTRNNSAPFLDMGMRLPECSRFNLFLRKILRFVARFIRKAIHHISKEQSIVNHNTDACIKALTESNQVILKTLFCMNELSESNKQLSQRIQELEKQLRFCNSTENAFSDELYLKFENEFRGSTDDIQRRVHYYLDKYIDNNVSKQGTDKILDLGCGRGEWIELLKESGYQVSGVDFNDAMVNECKNKGLDVVYGDAVTYLRTLEESSIQVVTSFQLIEHLPPMKLAEMMAEIFRVLKPHGMVILETPNANNLEVGAANFYSDPTHKRPIHKEYLKFLAKTAGFYDLEIVYWKENEINKWWNSVVEDDNTKSMDSTILRTVVESVKNTLYNSPDYALVATK